MRVRYAHKLAVPHACILRHAYYATAGLFHWPRYPHTTRDGGIGSASGAGSTGDLHIMDLRDSIAEFAHGVMKKLYSTDAVSRPRWTFTVITTVVLATVTVFLVGSAIVKDKRKAAQPNP